MFEILIKLNERFSQQAANKKWDPKSNDVRVHRTTFLGYPPIIFLTSILFHEFSHLFYSPSPLFLFLLPVCNQFSRGVFTMLGAVSPESFDTLHSYSNTFQMPFVTPWFPEEVSTCSQ